MVGVVGQLQNYDRSKKEKSEDRGRSGGLGEGVLMFDSLITKHAYRLEKFAFVPTYMNI